MKKNLVLFILIITYCTASACTSAIVSGKASADGRPLMWKHRDSDSERNKLVYFSKGKYNFIGVVNTQDNENKEIWMGSNSAGFSIMNTMSYNLDTTGSNGKKDEEGLLMKAALAECATVSDFEKFLNNGKGKWGVTANFGVIDAKGGAAYFETSTVSFVKYDVNDPLVAPKGFLIRTNFSFSGQKDKGLGYIRYMTAENIFNLQYIKNDISLDFILCDADRCLQHGLLKNDLYAGQLPESDMTEQLIPFRDYIVRNSSVSSMIIQGVKPQEDPALTTLWTVLGFQLTTLVTPVWVSGGIELPNVTIAKGSDTSPVNKKALILKDKCFPVKFGNGQDYLNLTSVLNKKGTGIIQKLLPKETVIIKNTEALLSSWRINNFSKSRAAEFYRWLDGYITDVYQQEFGI